MQVEAESQDWTSKIDFAIETLMGKVFNKCSKNEDKEIINKLFKCKTHLEEGQEFPVIELPNTFNLTPKLSQKWLMFVMLILFETLPVLYLQDQKTETNRSHKNPLLAQFQTFFD